MILIILISNMEITGRISVIISKNNMYGPTDILSHILTKYGTLSSLTSTPPVWYINTETPVYT
jgi:hypothetical protein